MKQLNLLVVLLLLLTAGLAACSGGNGDDETAGEQAGGASAGNIKEGRQLFVDKCSACHGPEAKGVAGLGKNLTTSEFIAGKSDSELVEVITNGIPAGEPPNDTSVPMPPKGGNPGLTDDDLYDIVAYLRSIHQ